ncbi:MAG: fibronectin type III domain-containing protein [Euryarchaeota archaeon]
MSVKPASSWWLLGMATLTSHGETPEFPKPQPIPVSDISMTPSGTSILMSWISPSETPGSIPTVSYIIAMVDKDTGDIIEERETTGTDLVWDGLQIDTEYCFVFYSVSELGVRSDPSDMVCVFTLKEVAPEFAAQLVHTGTSTFSISNAVTPTFTYYLSRSDVDFSVASVIDPASFTVTRNAGGDTTPYYILTSYTGETNVNYMQKTSFVCTTITTHTETTTSCTDNCGICCNPNAGNGSGNCFGGGACWCGSCAADGTICCGGCYGQDCTTTSRQVKDPVPSGYTERYGEWVKVDTTTTATTRYAEIGTFSLSNVHWDENYYQDVPMPKPYAASEFGEDGAPTGNTIPNRPAWDYNHVYFIVYDESGDVVWTRDNKTNPECFAVIEIKPMQEYNMRVSKLPPAPKGSYEFAIATDDDYLVHLEGSI